MIILTIEFYYSIFEDIIEAKFHELHENFDFNIPDIEYLISMSEHFKINPRREPYLMWVIRLADHLPLPRHWVERIGM